MKLKASLLLAAVLALVSCTSQSDESRQASTDQPAIKEPTQAGQQDNSVDATVDLSTVNVCELIPAELVATTVGGIGLKPARRSDYGSSQGCEYEIDPSGADTYEYLAIWLGSPSDFGDPQERMAIDRDLGQEVTTERLDGLGDMAYVIHNATEEQSTVYVLLKDRMYIEVTAEKYEDVRKVVELALSRV
jgi:hypothetical protein